ncbi:Protein kinase family protein [Rhynchospora pubera]|uniref:Protein kinase family protein n=1 Tax=Rhynchospora pubera TaxID=906938 RepID=A0AAV8HS29_9POAL|nr:Protein kinase family protein [Rhynchospora pubera]
MLGKFHPLTLMSSVILCAFLCISCLPEPQPIRLPCNNSIEIRPPFYLTNGTTPLCDDAINVKCGSVYKGPQVFLFSFGNVWFSLENILYASEGPEKHSLNRLVVRDPPLEQLLNTSDCGNLQISVQTSSHEHFNYEQYLSFSKNIRSFCHSVNLSSRSPIITYKYTLNYSAKTATTLPIDCYKKPPNASFEWTFSFDVHGVLFPLSAQYSYNLLPQQGCFNQSVVVGDCGDDCNPIEGDAGKTESSGETSRPATKSILIGTTIGFSGLFIVCCVFLILLKHNKLNCASLSSKLLMRRDTSEQYSYDAEMVESQYTQIFSYVELDEATEGFSASKELGDGGFGTVYKGKLRDGRIVAVKRLYKNNYKRTEQFVNEVEILSRLHHPNLVNLYGCTARTSSELLLVFEFVPNGTIADHLHGPHSSENILSWPIRLSIAVETADALAYLHAVEPQIIHRDVKTNNILLDDGFHVKVGDFGLSRLFPLDVTHVSTVPQGTPGYVDPVYHQCYQLTDKSDVYSFGVVLVELISSKPAVDITRSRDEINLASLALNKIQTDQLDELVDPALGFQSDPEVRQMISLVAEVAFRCLQSDRDMRPSMKEVLELLRLIQKGNFRGEKIGKLERDAVYSPNIVMSGWRSQSTTPNTSS